MTDRPMFLSGLGELAARYDGILSDVWGVVHDGVAACSSACAALQGFRARGGVVVLISNAPRPSRAVETQLRELKVPDTAYDAFVTSGDVTRELLAERHRGARLLHIGPERDRVLFEDLDVRLVAAEAAAELVVCTGLYDDTSETPDDYNGLLAALARRGLPFLCANPDRVVMRGADIVYCAGAISDRYRELGGRPQVIGKPHADIYRAALDALAGLRGAEIDRRRVLAIGDSVSTDLRGAADQGLDVLFIAGGIHAAELGLPEAPDPERIAALLAAENLRPVGVQCYLDW